jgi:putative FmdB family regulatory protein
MTMPTYEYECNACDHRFEEFQSFSDEPLKKCPQCKKKKLRRLLGTGAAVIFKGSGFYQTDYRSESYKKAAQAEQEAAKPKEAKPAESNGTAGKSDTAGGTSGEKSGGGGGKKAKSKA